MPHPALPLDRMYERHPGLSTPISEVYLEAACICLDRHHISPKEFKLNDDGREMEVIVQWEEPTQRSKNAWANTDDATRDGAYACALATTELTRNLVAVRRAETLTGADYYIGPANQALEDLEDCFRLEVSGTHLDISGVKSRLREKIQQSKEGKSNLPALATVVGFRACVIMLQTVELLQ